MISRRELLPSALIDLSSSKGRIGLRNMLQGETVLGGAKKLIEADELLMTPWILPKLVWLLLSSVWLVRLLFLLNFVFLMRCNAPSFTSNKIGSTAVSMSYTLLSASFVACIYSRSYSSGYSMSFSYGSNP